MPRCLPQVYDGCCPKYMMLPAPDGQCRRPAGIARDLCLTGRAFSGAEARELRLVGQVLPDREALLLAARTVALAIAAKSPLAVAGTKRVLLHKR